MKNFAPLCLLLCLLVAGCIEKPELNPEDTETLDTGLSFPNEFNFRTSRKLQVNITDPGNASQVKYSLSYTFQNEVHKVLSIGKTAVSMSQSLVIPTAVSELQVEKHTAGGIELKVVSIQGNEANVEFEETFVGSQANNNLVSENESCQDRLYAVNGQRGFYSIDLTGDDYTPTALDDLEGGGSIANALDQENGLVYYNVGTTLYQYDIYSTVFSVAHTGNPFNGSYPRLTFKDGYFWMSNNDKLYKVNATTNEVVNSYTINGFVNSTSGGDLAFDSQGELYLACFSGLYKFTDFTETTASIGRISAENFPFQLTSMAIDRQDRIFVGTNDANSNLIQISKEDGSYQIVKTYDFKINDLTAWRCELNQLEQQDSDNDGVIDELDDYPNDAEAAYDVYTPSEIGMGSLAFEDLWPVKGDYDFNDLVMGYRFVNVLNSDNLAVRTEIELTIRAVGAGNHNGFGIQIPLDESLISQVTGYEIFGSLVSLKANGLEQGQSIPTIIVFNDAFDHMSAPAAGAFVNTVSGQTQVAEKPFTIVINFTEPIDPAPLANPPYNPFLFNSFERGSEVHLSGHTPTDLADASLFGTEDDDTRPGLSRFYQSTDNTPWAINIIHTFRYPTEKSRIDKAYNYFLHWGESNGQNYADWYGDNSGYRNLSKIYQNN
ncbi:MAG: LruC domain-containing protein [Roseivirga sp.]|nr:LruC domain-containing protein [Roseivirga sp.]